MSESVVCRRQILTYEDCPRTERIFNTVQYIGIQMKRKEN